MLTLTRQDNGRRVAAHVGDMIELRLPETATSGYRWAPDGHDSRVLDLAETTALYPHAAPGSGGQAIFRFRVIGVGAGVLSLKSWRGWEGDGSIVERFAATIDAAP